MITCPTCHGRGEVMSPGYYVVQLFELGSWNDYLDFATLQDAHDKIAALPQWNTDRVRIRRHGKIVWTGAPQ